jgi:hypothetical protein
MAIGVGTNVSLRYKVETTRGTAPSGNWAFLRATSRNINLKKDLLESAEINSTRQRSDVRHGFNRVEGEIGFELSVTTYDELLAYAMGRANTNIEPANNTAVGGSGYNGWLMPAQVSGTNLSISSVTPPSGSTPGTIVFTLINNAANTNWIDLGYRPGDWVVSSGWSLANNNSGTANAPSQWRVMTVTGANLTCQIPTTASGQATASGAAGNTIDFDGHKVSIGTTLNTISIERAFTDVPNFQVFSGCAISTMSFTVRPDAIVGGTMGFIGMNADIDNATTSAGTPTAAATNSPLAAFDGSALFVKNDGTHIQATVTSIDFTLDNQRTLFPVVGSKFSQDVYEGVAKVTGTISLLLENRDHLTAFQDESTLNSVVVRLNELGTAEFLSFAFDRVKYTSADIDPPQNGPVIITCTFEALEQTYNGFDAAVESKEVFRIQRST